MRYTHPGLPLRHLPAIFVLLLAPLATHGDVVWQTCADGTRNFAFLKFYSLRVSTPDCALLNQGAQALYDAPVQFLIEVHWDRGRPEDLPDLYENQLMPVCTLDQEKALIDLYRRAGKGDKVDIRYTPGGGTRVSFNGELLFQDHDRDLLHAFYDLWFQKSPMADELMP